MRKITQLPLEIVEQWLKSDKYEHARMALAACEEREVPLEILEHGFTHSLASIREETFKLCKGRNIPYSIIERGLKDDVSYVREAALRICEIFDIPVSILNELSKDEFARVRELFYSKCINTDIDISFLKRGVEDGHQDVRIKALKACVGRNVPIGWIKKSTTAFLTAERLAAYSVGKSIKGGLLKLINFAIKNNELDVRLTAISMCGSEEIPIEYILREIRNGISTVQITAIEALKDRDIPREVFELVLSMGHRPVTLALFNACVGREIPNEFLEQGIQNKDADIRAAAYRTFSGRQMPHDLMVRGFSDKSDYIFEVVFEMCSDQKFSIELLEQICRNTKRRALVYRLCKDDDVITALVKLDLQSNNQVIRGLAMSTYQYRKMPIEMLQIGLMHDDYNVRVDTLRHCDATNLHAAYLWFALRDKHTPVRGWALTLCMHQEDPIEFVRYALRDEDSIIRVQALKICEKLSLPIQLVLQAFDDNELYVRLLAREIFKRATDKPSRTFEPPSTVYKRCVGGVIVCATIPEDAAVRGRLGDKCRASKAIITEVIGTFADVPVGISLYDHTVCYMKGDIIEVEDFDMDYAECSAGYHFFCTKEEAERYTHM